MLVPRKTGKHTCPQCSDKRKKKREHFMYDGMVAAFWAQVEIRGENQCWHWTGAKTSRGYGRPMFNGRRRMAHRWSLEFATGDSGDGRLALHSCDNPRCVNPKHLRWGTQLENIQDRVFRGRNGSACGSSNGAAKLDANQVRSIRADSRTGREIASDYGASQMLISAIKRGIIWSHIDAVEATKGG